jgi:type II secretory pathway component PulK
MRKQRTPAAAKPKGSPKRRGAVLVAVILVVTVLSLAAYQYSDMMLSEYRAADNAQRMAQARALADSGIHYAAAILSNPDYITNNLNSNIWNNSGAFFDIQVPTDEDKGLPGRFTLIAPLDPTDGNNGSGCRYGVIDEASKINLNMIMKQDPSGQRLHDMLILLPNMTESIANSIIDWIDADSTPRDGGAEDDYYSALNPPYHCKNGPLDSLEELLLVQGVTPQLLFGNDLNRNGIFDPEEDDGSGTFNPGWSAFLTVYSREQNADAKGNPYAYVNDKDLATLYQTLSEGVDDSLAKFIIIYRQYGGSKKSGVGSGSGGSGGAGGAGGSGGSGGAGGSAMGQKAAATTPSSAGTVNARLVLAMPTTGGGSNNNNKQPVVGNIASVDLDFNKNGGTKINSLFDLVNAQVTVPGKGQNDPTTIYYSPLNDIASQRDLLPKLFGAATAFQAAELPARINVTTAPQEVLSTLPELSDTDVQTLISTRPSLSSSDAPADIFQTLTWLLTEANISADALAKLEKYITTRTQVYRVQSVGYFDGKGPSARVEAIIDTNGGHPRIIMWRDLTELGKGWTKPQ